MSDINQRKQDLIDWSKYNLQYLKFKSHLDFLENAQSGDPVPETLVPKVEPGKTNSGFNTADTAWFIAELIQKYEDAMSVFEESLERLKKVGEL